MQPFADVLKNSCSSKFCNTHRKTSVLESLLIKLQAWRLQKNQMFSCEYCKILKNSFFYRLPLVAASEIKSSFQVNNCSKPTLNSLELAPVTLMFALNRNSPVVKNNINIFCRTELFIFSLPFSCFWKKKRAKKILCF